MTNGSGRLNISIFLKINVIGILIIDTCVWNEENGGVERKLVSGINGPSIFLKIIK